MGATGPAGRSVRHPIHYNTCAANLACGAPLGPPGVSWSKDFAAVTCDACLRSCAKPDVTEPPAERAELLAEIGRAALMKRRQFPVVASPLAWAWAYRACVLAAELERSRVIVVSGGKAHGADEILGRPVLRGPVEPITLATPPLEIVSESPVTEYRLDEDAIPAVVVHKPATPGKTGMSQQILTCGPCKCGVVETHQATADCGRPAHLALADKIVENFPGVKSALAEEVKRSFKLDNPNPRECYELKPATLLTYGDIELTLVKETSDSKLLAMHVYRKCFGVMTVEVHVGTDKFKVYRPGTRMLYREGWELLHALCAVDEMVQGVREAIEGVEA